MTDKRFFGLFTSSSLIGYCQLLAVIITFYPFLFAQNLWKIPIDSKLPFLYGINGFRLICVQ